MVTAPPFASASSYCINRGKTHQPRIFLPQRTRRRQRPLRRCPAQQTKQAEPPRWHAHLLVLFLLLPLVVVVVGKAPRIHLQHRLKAVLERLCAVVCACADLIFVEEELVVLV